MGKVMGNNTTISYGSDYGRVMVTSADHLGTPHTYGGVGIDTTGPAVKGNVTVPLGNTGKSAQVTAKAVISRANMAKGLIRAAKIAGGPGGLVAGLALEALIDYGLKNASISSDGRLIAGKESDAYYPQSDGYIWRQNYTHTGAYYGPEAACVALTPEGPENWKFQQIVDFGPDLKACRYVMPNGNVNQPFSVIRIAPSDCKPGYYVDKGVCTSTKPLTEMSEQEIEDWIASRDGWPTSSAVALQSMLQYPDVRPILRPYPENGVSVTGPESVPGATTKSSESVKLVPGTNVEAPPGATQTDPGTKTTTSTKTHPITYNGSEVKFGTITNNVTNITNNVTNVTTTETTKTEEKQDDNEPDQCEKHPNTIGCKEVEFDTPEGEIPRKQIDVSWSPVDLGLGGGSCPAPVQIYENKQFSYQLACDNLLLIKTMVIAIALFVGGMIIFGGRADQ